MSGRVYTKSYSFSCFQRWYWLHFGILWVKSDWHGTDTPSIDLCKVKVRSSSSQWPLVTTCSLTFRKVIFGSEFEYDGQLKLRHLVYWAFQGQGEVTDRLEHVSVPNCQTAFSATRARTWPRRLSGALPRKLSGKMWQTIHQTAPKSTRNTLVKTPCRYLATAAPLSLRKMGKTRIFSRKFDLWPSITRLNIDLGLKFVYNRKIPSRATRWSLLQSATTTRFETARGSYPPTGEGGKMPKTGEG